MGIQFQQTDSNAPCGFVVGCSGATLANTSTARQASEGGTAGSTTAIFKIAGGTSNQACVMFEFTPGFADWQAASAGDPYVIRWNITAAADVTWTDTYICRFNSGCSNLETLGSLTGQTTSLNSTGVKTHTITDAVGNASATATDSVYIVLVCEQVGGHGNIQVDYIPDQLIDTPLSSTAPQTVTPAVSSATGDSPAPTGSGTGSVGVAPAVSPATASAQSPTTPQTVTPGIASAASNCLAPTGTGSGAAPVSPAVASSASACPAPTGTGIGVATAAIAAVAAVSAICLSPTASQPTAQTFFPSSSIVQTLTKPAFPAMSPFRVSPWAFSLRQGLRLFTPLWEGSGDVHDIARGNTGTLQTSASWTNTPRGRAIRVDDVLGSRVQFGSIGFTRTAGQPLSVAAYVRPDDTATAGTQYIVGTRSGSGAGDLWKLILNTSGALKLEYDPVGSGGSVTTDVPPDDVPDDVFTMVGGMYDGSDLVAFIDGVEVKRNDNTGSGFPSAAIDADNYAIGDHTEDQQPFLGDILWVAVWDRALTPVEWQTIGNWPFSMMVESPPDIRYIGQAAGGPQTVNPGVASATAAGVAPAGTGSGSAPVSPSVCPATAQGIAPSGTGIGTASVSPAVCSAATAAIAPSVPQIVLPAVASATGAALAPTGTGTGSAGVSPVVASATASATSPAVTGSGSAPASPQVASAAAQALAPAASTGGQFASPGVASASASALSPTGAGSGSAPVAPAVSSATAAATSPTGTGSGTATASPSVAPATAAALAPSVPTLNPVITISRTSGPAPFAVKVSASASTSSNTTNPFRDCRFQWDFDDSANAITWTRGSRTGISSNTEEGPESGHIYLVDGTYTITLTMTDTDGTTAQDTVQVTADDPEATMTMFVYTTQASPGWVAGVDYPTGATLRTSATFSTMIADEGNNTWHMWGRGETVASSDWNLSSDNVMISSVPEAYQTGADIGFTGTGTIYLGANGSVAATNLCVWDVDFSGEGTDNSAIERWNSCTSGWANLTVYNCTFDTQSIYPGEQNTGATVGEGLNIVNCTWINALNGGQSVLAVANDVFVGGLEINHGTSSPQQLFRILTPHRMAFIHSNLNGCADGGYSLLRVNGADYTTDADLAQFVYVADSKLDGRNGGTATNARWLGQFSAVQDGEDARLEDILVERNLYIPNTVDGTQRIDVGGCTRFTFRRNVWADLSHTGSTSHNNGVHFRNQTGQTISSTDCQIVNVAIYAASGVSIDERLCAMTNVDAATLDVRNNLGLHDGTGAIDFSQNGVPGTESNNHDASGQAVSDIFVSATPTAYADFDLADSTYAQNNVHDGGTDVNDVIPDGFLRSIFGDTTPSVGMAEFQAAGGGQTVTPGVASATANGIAPTGTGTGSAQVSPAVCLATAAGLAPVGAGSGTATSSPSVCPATSAALAPAVGQTVQPGVASATAAALAPAGSGTGTATVLPGVSPGMAQGLSPVGTGSGTATVSPTTASATTAALAPVTGKVAQPGVASASAQAIAPSGSGTGSAAATPVVASANTQAIAPARSATGSATATPQPASATANALQAGTTGGAAFDLSIEFRGDSYVTLSHRFNSFVTLSHRFNSFVDD